MFEDVASDMEDMYGSVAGAGIVATPVALAFTGPDRAWILAICAVGLLSLVLGVVLLRRSHRALFR